MAWQELAGVGSGVVQDTSRTDEQEHGLPVPERIKIGGLAKDWLRFSELDELLWSGKDWIGLVKTKGLDRFRTG